MKDFAILGKHYGVANVYCIPNELGTSIRERFRKGKRAPTKDLLAFINYDENLLRLFLPDKPILRFYSHKNVNIVLVMLGAPLSIQCSHFMKYEVQCCHFDQWADNIYAFCDQYVRSIKFVQ